MKTRERTLRYAAVLGLCGSISACVGVDSIQAYPDGWAEITAPQIGDCPQLTGTYSVAGLRKGMDDRCGKQPGNKRFDDTGWDCSIRLEDASTLGQQVDRITLSQPDSKTLIILGEASDGRRTVRTLHRDAGNFTCETPGLVISKTVSLFGGEDDALATIGGLMVLRGGTSRLDKVFSIAADGSLLMNVSERNQGIFFPFMFSATFSAWVQWPKERAP